MLKSISGTYTRAELSRLLYPIAWSGTVSAAERLAHETAISDLVEEARCALDADRDAVGVVIECGVVVATIHED